jgi:phosphate transport system substrate-binding protein
MSGQKEAAQDKDAGKTSDKTVMPHRGGRSMVVAIIALIVVVIIVVAILETGALNSNKESVTLAGAGSTLVMPLMLKWADVYYNTTSQNVKVNYGGGGSGAGITQIEANNVNFAGTDAPLTVSEASTNGLAHIPETIGAVVVAYNEPTVKTLKLDGLTLARIYMKNITAWDDPAIVALNPDVVLPNATISTIVRSDSSGTTYTFSGYLSTVSGEFEAIYGQGKTVSWKDAIGASGNPGVAQTVMTTPNAIGYVELAYAQTNSIPFAMMKNHDGNYVWASPTNASAAAAAATTPLPSTGSGDWSQVNILDSPGANSYPLCTYTYILVHKELYNDQTKMSKTDATDLVAFLWWVIHDGQSYSNALGYAPLPSSVVSLDEATLNGITYNGVAVR